jgi:predicted TIM-barrel fold metal-dependent hydrolase
MGLLARHENVHVKLSGFYAFAREGWRYPQTDLAPAMRRLRDTFGAGRLLWGSDFSPVLEHNTFRQALHVIEEACSCFTSADLDRIHRRNAERIIKERMPHER